VRPRTERSECDSFVAAHTLQFVRPGPDPSRRPLLEVAAVFGWLGVRAFGGPAAHVALMRRELVERRAWVAGEEFNRLFAACNLIPGPGSTQLALLLGRRRAGWLGMGVAAVLFIGPGVALMLVLGELYIHGGTGSSVQRVLLGVEAAVVGIVVAATVDLSRRGIRQVELGAAAAAGLGLGVAHVTPVALLLLGGVIVVLWRGVAGGWRTGNPAASAAGLAVTGGPIHAATAGTLLPLGLTFLKIGAIAFGSGYVLLPFLRADLVGGSFGCTDGQIADAFAAGQATPGPVFATAAFLGDIVAGVPGGLIAAIAIFAPSFAFVALLEPILRFVEREPRVRDALDGVGAAAIGLIGSVSVDLGRVALVGAPEVVAAALALLLLLWRPTAQPGAVGIGLLAGAVLALT
jgi:chromate transporter